MSRVLAGLLGAVILVTGLVAPARGATPHVNVVGDSLTLQAYYYFGFPNPAGWTVDGANGRTLYYSVGLIRRRVARTRPDVLVVALGSNDVNRHLPSRVNEVDHLGPCTVVTTVKVRRVSRYYDANWQIHARRWNRSVWASQARGRAHVADWNGVSRGHSGWFMADGLHLTRAGGVAYRALLRSTVAGCSIPPPPPPTTTTTTTTTTTSTTPDTTIPTPTTEPPTTTEAPVTTVVEVPTTEIPDA